MPNLEHPTLRGPNPTLMSPTAKSPYMAMTAISAKEGPQFYAAVIAMKSMCVISPELRRIGSSLSDTNKTFEMPEYITMPQLVA